MAEDPSRRRRKCLFCRREFIPDPRAGSRQKSCSREDCRQKRKQRAQKQWTQSNPDYFHGRYESTRAWREKNPDYQQKWRAQVKAKSFEIQDEIQDKKMVKSLANSITLVLPKGLFEGEIQDEIRLKSQINSTIWVAQ